MIGFRLASKRRPVLLLKLFRMFIIINIVEINFDNKE